MVYFLSAVHQEELHSKAILSGTGLQVAVNLKRGREEILR